MSNLPGVPLDEVEIGAAVKVIFEERRLPRARRSRSGRWSSNRQSDADATQPERPKGLNRCPRPTVSVAPRPNRSSAARRASASGSYKGKVAAVGVGHSPTARRWDGTAENTIGAWSLMALRKAIDDAGVPPEEIDGLVFLPTTTTGAHWPADRPIPMDIVNAYQTTDDPLDGIAKLTDTWLLKNMPELTNVQVRHGGDGLHVPTRSRSPPRPSATGWPTTAWC